MGKHGSLAEASAVHGMNAACLMGRVITTKHRHLHCCQHAYMLPMLQPRCCWVLPAGCLPACLPHLLQHPRLGVLGTCFDHHILQALLQPRFVHLALPASPDNLVDAADRRAGGRTSGVAAAAAGGGGVRPR